MAICTARAIAGEAHARRIKSFLESVEAAVVMISTSLELALLVAQAAGRLMAIKKEMTL
jgi:predicted Co/Zn/Cd cation transporter (cation efflux family)